ncbi:hypothetical protein QMT05_03220 [Cronobacter malonaticus]|uniref:hypothetical protein n=1 Tax=Cronobacter malonaticus TaxID=413503 RepID=UPI0024C2B243|nr:hypothetical protein [Cronobacter malonaticus]MDK1175886.1 hypothetical protein [Cronobacter malonaticus]MDK1685999.1 hypothetical protein [Cronobacter malonaticus]
MKFKGTPGPWTGKDVGICRQDRAGLQLGFIMTHDENRVAECAANARLIAAAPDLLEALQLSVKAMQEGRLVSYPEWYGVINKARAAIAKAIGEEE